VNKGISRRALVRTHFHRLGMLLVPVAVALGYLGAKSDPHEARVEIACQACAEKLGHALGEPWQRCVIDTLKEEMLVARRTKRDDYFAVPDFKYSPLVAKNPGFMSLGGGLPAEPTSLAGFKNTDTLINLMRNFTCDYEDGGSQPIRTMTWEYVPPDPCAVSPKGEEPSFVHKPGYLPAGDDLTDINGAFTEAEASAVCLSATACKGFTFNSPTRGTAVKQNVLFKSKIGDIGPSSEWHTLKRKSPQLDCRKGKRAPPPRPMRLQVDVLRESPPVYVVHDFASEEECDHMVNLTVPEMSPSVVFSGKEGSTSTYRSSYSVNMFPDFDDEADPVTRLARRKFAFAREVAEYEGAVEGEGQEPVNAVYYKDYGDQYRPHCDGDEN